MENVYFDPGKTGVHKVLDIKRTFAIYSLILNTISVPEFIDPVFTKTSPKRSFSLNRKQAFWLVFAKTGSIISGTGDCTTLPRQPYITIK